MHYFRHDFQAMGTLCELQFYTPTQRQAQQVIALALEELARLEAKYSRYRPDSYLSQINQCAAQGGDMIVDAETASLLDYAAACYQQSDGLFDISSGILRRCWRFDQYQLPEPDTIDALLAHIGWSKIDWTAPRLAFSMPGMELDFGGIVKEYTADRVAALCWAQGLRSGLVNLGGDIKVIGPQANDQPWRIAIRDPRQPDGVFDTLLLSAGALASSGDYERRLLINGKRYGHIINPQTGWPVHYLSAVSVVADFCVVAGSAATISLLKEQSGIKWLQDLGLKHLWIDAQGQSGGNLFSSTRP